MTAGPTPKPEKYTGLLWWTLGLLVVGIVILGFGGILAARFLSSSVESIRVETQPERPLGSQLSRGDTTGIAPYPSATLSEPGSLIELEGVEGDTAPIHVARYQTKDTAGQVDVWYRQKLGPDFEREGSGQMELKKKIFGVEVSSDDIAFAWDTEAQLLAVVIRKRMGVTEIVHIRVGGLDPQ